MSLQNHLPLAVGYRNQEALLELTDIELQILVDECGRWHRQAGQFAEGLSSVSAKAIWVRSASQTLRP